MSYLAMKCEPLTADEIHRIATAPLPEITIVKSSYAVGSNGVGNSESKNHQVDNSSYYEQFNVMKQK